MSWYSSPIGREVMGAAGMVDRQKTEFNTEVDDGTLHIWPTKNEQWFSNMIWSEQGLDKPMQYYHIEFAQTVQRP